MTFFSGPIRVFVGTEPMQYRAERVLEHSLRKHTTSPIALTWMRAGDPGFDWSQGPTQFTMFRFAIPALCNYEGFAIYLDVDMMLLGDIKELWDLRKPGKWLKSKHDQGDCVSVIDCSAVDLTIDELRQMRKWDARARLAPIAENGVPDEWNMLDKLGGKLVHFTALDTQPWIKTARHPDPAAVAKWEEFERVALAGHSADVEQPDARSRAGGS